MNKAEEARCVARQARINKISQAVRDSRRASWDAYAALVHAETDADVMIAGRVWRKAEKALERAIQKRKHEEAK